jgi:hypothetical protein
MKKCVVFMGPPQHGIELLSKDVRRRLVEYILGAGGQTPKRANFHQDYPSGLWRDVDSNKRYVLSYGLLELEKPCLVDASS